jgi:hypothetical protein
MFAFVWYGCRHKNEWLDVDKSAALCTALVQFNQFNAAPQLLPEELNGFPDEIKAPAAEKQTLSHYI